jgi:hypothetical protein
VTVAQAEADLSTELSQAIAARVREELARRRLSRQALADLAKISISTLEKASGRPPALHPGHHDPAGGGPGRLAARAGPRGRLRFAAGPGARSLGSYSRTAVAWLEGEYLTLRPSFEDPKAVYAYRTEIAWDEASSSLGFREAARQDADFTQKGAVSLSNQSGHTYLITNEQGQFRLVILGRPAIGGEMYGMLTTLQAGHGSHLTPAAAPIALIPLRRVPDPAFGRIATGGAHYDDYRAILARVTDKGFARFFAG